MNNEEMQAITSFKEQSNQSLHQHVTNALQQYLIQLDETFIVNLYDMVLVEIEEPLVKAVMNYCKNNQTKAAIVLGLSRGTLRTKMVRYNMLKQK